MADAGVPLERGGDDRPLRRSAGTSAMVRPRAVSTPRGQFLSIAAALSIFLFIVAALLGALPDGLQNALSDVAARVYIDVPRAGQQLVTGPTSTTTTTLLPATAGGTAPVNTTTTVFEERGPSPTQITVTTAPLSTFITTTTSRRTTTTAPPSTDAPPPTDPPPTDPPSIVIPTTQPECINPSVLTRDAKIQSDNNHIVLVTVTFAGSIQHMQAAVAGQSFSSLAKVNDTTFIGSVSSASPVKVGTNVVILACNGSINQTTPAHA